MVLTSEAAVELGLEMLGKETSIKFFELRLRDANAMEHVAQVFIARGCDVEYVRSAGTLRIFCA
jgi:hypothetical protein